MSRTIDMHDLAGGTRKTLVPPQHRAQSTVPNRTTHRPISFPPKGHRRTLPGVRSARRARAFGLFWGAMPARLAAIIVAVLSALAVSSMPMAHADNPPSANPCDISIFVKNNPKYCAKFERANPFRKLRALSGAE
jgi:hypothetical protein